MMLTPLEEFGARMAALVTAEAAALPLHTFLRVAGFLILGIALFFLIMRLERKARQALVRATAPKIGHYVWLAGMLVLLFPVWTRDRNGFWEYLIPILVTLLFFAAEAALLFWRRAGLALSLVYLWAALPLKELTVIAVTEKDRAALSTYSPAGMMGVYAADRYLLDRASALALAAFCLTVWRAVYYGRRRLLFHGRRRLFLPVLLNRLRHMRQFVCFHHHDFLAHRRSNRNGPGMILGKNAADQCRHAKHAEDGPVAALSPGTFPVHVPGGIESVSLRQTGY